MTVTPEPSAEAIELTRRIRNKLWGDYFLHDREAAEEIEAYASRKVSEAIAAKDAEIAALRALLSQTSDDIYRCAEWDTAGVLLSIVNKIDRALAPPSAPPAPDMDAVATAAHHKRDDAEFLRAIATEAVAHARAQAIEDVIAFILGGRFLHDDAPPKRFAEEVVAGIRRTLAAQPAPEKGET